MSMSVTFPPETISGTATSWIPLTTSWSVPILCGTVDRTFPDNLQFFTITTLTSAGNTNFYVRVDCQPEQVLRWWEPGSASDRSLQSTIFSIGPLQCPGGYTTATTSSSGLGVMDIACCPRNYTLGAIYPAGIPGECTSSASSGQTIFSTGTQVSILNEAKTFTALHINGRALISTPSIPSNASPTNPSPLTAPLPSTSPSPSTLPKNAIIGLSIGIFIATAFVFATGLLIYHLRRKKQISTPEKSIDDMPRALGYRIELPGEDQRFEIDGRLKVSELLEEKSSEHELGGEDTPIELPADPTRLQVGDGSENGDSFRSGNSVH